jgi:hypothetical protein
VHHAAQLLVLRHISAAGHGDLQAASA